MQILDHQRGFAIQYRPTTRPHLQLHDPLQCRQLHHPPQTKADKGFLSVGGWGWLEENLQTREEVLISHLDRWRNEEEREEDWFSVLAVFFFLVFFSMGSSILSNSLLISVHTWKRDSSLVWLSSSVTNFLTFSRPILVSRKFK